MTVLIERRPGTVGGERSIAKVFVDTVDIGSAPMSGGACLLMKALAERLGAEASIEEKEG